MFVKHTIKKIIPPMFTDSWLVDRRKVLPNTDKDTRDSPFICRKPLTCCFFKISHTEEEDRREKR
jgi:hypothetical protein